MGAAFGEAVNLSLHLNKKSVFALPAMHRRACGSMLKCGRETISQAEVYNEMHVLWAWKTSNESDLNLRRVAKLLGLNARLEDALNLGHLKMQERRLSFQS